MFFPFALLLEDDLHLCLEQGNQSLLASYNYYKWRILIPLNLQADSFNQEHFPTSLRKKKMQ